MAGLLTVDVVASELRSWARGRFDRRRANCALSVLVYVERIRGKRLLWPRVVARFAWRLVWGRPDRLEAVARAALAQLGCSITLEPRRGDVGLVALPGVGLTACICAGSANRSSPALWAARLERAAKIERVSAAVAWRVTCPRR